MTCEEQQAIFDAIRERSDRPGTFSAVNGVRLTALCDGGAEGEVWASSTAACTAR